MRSSRIYLAAAAAATFGACAPLAEQAALNTPETRTTLVVANANAAEMVIYVVHGATRARVGSVPSMSSAKFPITDVVAGGRYGEVRIVADQIGSGRTYMSDVIHLVPGSQVEVTLANNLAASRYSVF